MSTSDAVCHCNVLTSLAFGRQAARFVQRRKARCISLNVMAFATAHASVDECRACCRNDDNHADRWHARTSRLSNCKPNSPLPRHGGNNNAADGAGAARHAEWNSARALQGRAPEGQRQNEQRQWPDSILRRQCAQYHSCASDGKGQGTICMRTVPGDAIATLPLCHGHIDFSAYLDAYFHCRRTCTSN